MDTKHEILLEQILEELRAQNRTLQEIKVRIDGLERTLSKGREFDQPVSETERRS